MFLFSCTKTEQKPEIAQEQKTLYIEEPEPLTEKDEEACNQDTTETLYIEKPEPIPEKKAWKLFDKFWIEFQSAVINNNEKKLRSLCDSNPEGIHVLQMIEDGYLQKYFKKYFKRINKKNKYYSKKIIKGNIEKVTTYYLHNPSDNIFGNNQFIISCDGVDIKSMQGGFTDFYFILKNGLYKLVYFESGGFLYYKDDL